MLTAVVLVRHGDRRPMSRPTLVKTTKRSDIQDDRVNLRLTKLIDAINRNEEIIRNGLDDSLKEAALVSDYQSDFSLSQIGLLQSLEVGEYLKSRYFAEGQFITSTTSLYERTLQSILAVLMGYSTEDFPKHSAEIKSSREIYFCDIDSSDDDSNMCDCDRMQQIKQIRSKLRKWTLAEPNIEYIYDLLGIANDSALTNKDHVSYNVASPSRVLDWLISDYYCRSDRLPCITTKLNKTECLNFSVVHSLQELVDMNHLSMVTDETYLIANSLAMYPFLLSVYRMLKKKATEFHQNDVALPDIHFYSTHDIALGPLFNSLGISLVEKAPYASRFSIELWQNPRDDEFFLTFLFNGQDINQHLLICNEEAKYPRWRVLHTFPSTQKVLCPLSKLHEFLSHTFFNGMPGNDFSSACKL